MNHWTEFTITVEYDLTGTGEESVELCGQYLPARPAPYCMNHDSPAFSDSGDPMELELLYINGKDLKFFDPSSQDELWEMAYQNLEAAQ